MYEELELKVKVRGFDDLLNELSESGAEFIEGRLERDIFLDTKGDKLKKNDSCLRLRIDTAGEKQTVFLTFKGPKEKTEVKRRKEINVKVSEADAIERLLLALGYAKKFVLEKKRRIWRLKGCEVSLDEVPLVGNFVEIEGADTRSISQVQKTLGLDNLKHIEDSYPMLAERELALRGIDEHEILLSGQC